MENMNRLVIIDPANEIALNYDFIERYKDFQKIKLEMELLEKEFKEELKEAMEKTGQTSILLEGFSVTYRKGSKRTTIDTKRLKEENPEIAKQYEKETETSASVVIKCE